MKLIMKLQKSADDADWQFAQGPMDDRIMLSFIGNASADTNPDREIARDLLGCIVCNETM
jgi:hypothetical protein